MRPAAVRTSLISAQDGLSTPCRHTTWHHQQLYSRHVTSSTLQRPHPGNMILIQASIKSNCYITMSSAASKHTDAHKLHNVRDKESGVLLGPVPLPKLWSLSSDFGAFMDAKNNLLIILSLRVFTQNMNYCFLYLSDKTSKGTWSCKTTKYVSPICELSSTQCLLSSATHEPKFSLTFQVVVNVPSWKDATWTHHEVRLLLSDWILIFQISGQKKNWWNEFFSSIQNTHNKLSVVNFHDERESWIYSHQRLCVHAHFSTIVLNMTIFWIWYRWCNISN